MNKYQKVVRFYRELLTLLRQDKFDQILAEKAVAIFKEDEEFLHWTTFGLKEAREAHQVRGRMAVAEAAFEDLAPYMRAPEALRMVRAFIFLAGANHDNSVFVHVVNRRLLGEERKQGPAIVTVVVNDYGMFENLISSVPPPTVHCSFGETAPTI